MVLVEFMSVIVGIVVAILVATVIATIGVDVFYSSFLLIELVELGS